MGFSGWPSDRITDIDLATENLIGNTPKETDCFC